jgi:hypothetical protein
VLNVFKGDFEPSLAGPPFPGIETMISSFDLAYQSKPLESTLPNLRGDWHLQVYTKKHPKDYILAKHFEKISSRDQLQSLEKAFAPDPKPAEDQIAGQSPHFDRKKHSWLSDKEFQTRKPD